MKKVIRLVGVQLWAILGSMFALGQQKKRKSNSLYLGFAALAILLSGLSFFYAYIAGMGLRVFNSIDLLPTLFMSLTSVILLFTTVYKIKGTLFGFKDYDMVMSLPVSNSQIVASRLILLYSINIVFVLIIMIPMMLAYGILAQPGIQFYVFSILTLFFIPLIPIIIAAIIGTILTYLTMRFRYSNIVYIVFVFLLLIGMMVFPYLLGDSNEALVEISQEINNQVSNIYPMSQYYSKAVIEGDIVSLIIFMLASLLAFSAFSLLIGKVFKRINSVLMTGRYRRKGQTRLKSSKSSSPLKALYKKELKRYFASVVYVMNTGFGVVIMVLGAIALPFIDINTMTGEMNITGAVKDLIPIFVVFCIATSSTTMASISIEGKHFWIAKSLPVSELMIFKSKILVNFTILAPVLFATLLICFTMELPFIDSLLILLLAASFSVFVSIYGLVINLSFPSLIWTNETVIVKQSTSSMISIFTSIGMVAIQYLLIMVTGDMKKSILLFLVLIWVINLILYKRLSTRGIRQFKDINC